MEVGDCSLWHHLIFCEELVNNDGENDVVCWLCKEAVLGHPAYKCLECNFCQHKSCIEPTRAIKMQVKHHLRDRHHLMFVEELNNISGNKKVVCPGCEEPVFGPAYKCSMPECTFLLHNSCTKLSHVIQHPVHPKHTLFLRVPFETSKCYACLKYWSGSFFYRCSPCNFDLDIKCVFRWQFNDDKCHQHTLIPMRKKLQFTCEACVEEIKGIAYLCSFCRVLIHRECDRFPLTIKTTTHDNSLTRTYCLCQVRLQGNIFCRICYKKVNIEYAAYYCQVCSYIAHLDCAYWAKDSSSTIKSMACNSSVYESYLIHLVEGINLTEDERAGPREIVHFSHPQHSLILSNEELVGNMRCNACMQFIIFVPFYSCAKCSFFLHRRCINPPTSIKRGPFHEHPRILFSKAPSFRGLFKCRGCSRYRHGFTYTCHECESYYYDVQCFMIPETLNFDGHQHSLFMAIRSFETCNACGKDGLNFTCTDCNKFIVCITCATLPLVARCEYDTHILKLSYTREDDSGEYYCLICEEERNYPDHWFYYCVKCNFSAHSRCVLGANPYIKYGKTYIDEAHQHPLTIVQETKHSPRCKVCRCLSFDDIALECTQCKFIVHKDCLRYLS